MSVSSLTQLFPTLCDPMDFSTPGFPVLHQLSAVAQTHVHQIVVPFNHFTLCHPILLLPLIPPSISVFSNESVLHIRRQLQHQGRRPRGATPHPRSSRCTGTGKLGGATPSSRSEEAAVRRYPLSR